MPPSKSNKKNAGKSADDIDPCQILREAERSARNRHLARPVENASTQQDVAFTCRACRRKADGGNPKYAHHDLCEKSIYYGKADLVKQAMRDEKIRRQKEGTDKRTGMAQAEKALTDFFGDNEQAKQLLQRAESEKRKELSRRGKSKQFSAPSDDTKDDTNRDENPKPNTSMMPFENMLSAKYLCECIGKTNEKRTTVAPKAVEAIIRYVHDLCPSLKRDCNEISGGVENEAKAHWFGQNFPPGTITFKVPRQDATAKPNLDYTAAEDVKIAFVRWELQCKEKLICPFCKNSELIHGRFGIKKTSVHPIFDVGGKLMWLVVMHYNCSGCNKQVRGDDQTLLDSLPDWMRESFPCHPKWNTKQAPFRLTRELVRMLEHPRLFDGSTAYIKRLIEDHYFEDRDRFLSALKRWLNNQEDHERNNFTRPGFMTFTAWLGDVELPNPAELHMLRERVNGYVPSESSDKVLFKSLDRSKKITESKKPIKKQGGDENNKRRLPPHNVGFPGVQIRDGIPQPILVPPHPPKGPPEYNRDGVLQMTELPYPPPRFPPGHDRLSMMGYPMVPHGMMAPGPPGGGMFFPLNPFPPWIREPNASAKKAPVEPIAANDAKDGKGNRDVREVETETLLESSRNETHDADMIGDLLNREGTGESKVQFVSESKDDVERGSPEAEVFIDEAMKVDLEPKGETEAELKGDDDDDDGASFLHIEPAQLPIQIDLAVPSGSVSQSGSTDLPTKNAASSDDLTLKEAAATRVDEANKQYHFGWQNMHQGKFVFVPFQSQPNNDWTTTTMEQAYPYVPYGTPVKRSTDISSKRRMEDPDNSGGSKKSKILSPVPRFGHGPPSFHQYTPGFPYMYHPAMGPHYPGYPPTAFAPYTDAIQPLPRKGKKSNQEENK